MEAWNSNWKVKRIFCLELEAGRLLDEMAVPPHLLCVVNERELKKISTLKTPNAMLAEVEMSSDQPLPDLSNGLHLYLDGIKDPGNMGTILRIADRFGIDSVLCSPECVEVYNPKVVQSTMGSLFRVNFITNSSINFIERFKGNGTPVLAAAMNGKDLYETPLPENAVLILGSESHGLSEEANALVDQELTIPNFGAAESLNVAVAAAVFCSEFRARSYRS